MVCSRIDDQTKASKGDYVTLELAWVQTTVTVNNFMLKIAQNIKPKLIKYDKTMRAVQLNPY